MKAWFSKCCSAENIQDIGETVGSAIKPIGDAIKPILIKFGQNYLAGIVRDGVVHLTEQLPSELGQPLKAELNSAINATLLSNNQNNNQQPEPVEKVKRHGHVKHQSLDSNISYQTNETPKIPIKVTTNIYKSIEDYHNGFISNSYVQYFHDDQQNIGTIGEYQENH
jgi:hypothetical protein